MAILTLVESALALIYPQPAGPNETEADVEAMVRGVVINYVNDTFDAAYRFADYLDDLRNNGV